MGNYLTGESSVGSISGISTRAVEEPAAVSEAVPTGTLTRHRRCKRRNNDTSDERVKDDVEEVSPKRLVS